METNSINPIPGRKRAKKEKKELVDKKKQITREDRSQPIVFVSVPAPSSTSTAQVSSDYIPGQSKKTNNIIDL